MESVRAWQSRECQQALDSVLAKLTEIVTDHPSSALAVQIITDQQIGILSLGGVAQIACLEHLRAGNFQSALAAAKLTFDIATRDELHHEIGIAQARAGDLQAALTTANLLSNNRRSPLSLLTEAPPPRCPARTYRRDTGQRDSGHPRSSGRHQQDQTWRVSRSNPPIPSSSEPVEPSTGR